MKRILQILLVLGIIAATGLGYLVSLNLWRFRFEEAAKDAGHDTSTFEGLSSALSDPRVDVPNYSMAVLISGAVSLVVLFTLSVGFSHSKGRRLERR